MTIARHAVTAAIQQTAGSQTIPHPTGAEIRTVAKTRVTASPSAAVDAAGADERSLSVMAIRMTSRVPMAATTQRQTRAHRPGTTPPQTPRTVVAQMTLVTMAPATIPTAQIPAPARVIPAVGGGGAAAALAQAPATTTRRTLSLMCDRGETQPIRSPAFVVQPD